MSFESYAWCTEESIVALPCPALPSPALPSLPRRSSVNVVICLHCSYRRGQQGQAGQGRATILFFCASGMKVHKKSIILIYKYQSYDQNWCSSWGIKNSREPVNRLIALHKCQAVAYIQRLSNFLAFIATLKCPFTTFASWAI